MPYHFIIRGFSQLPRIKPPKDKILLGGFHIGTFWKLHFIRSSGGLEVTSLGKEGLSKKQRGV
jgi:hypothetical protein